MLQHTVYISTVGKAFYDILIYRIIYWQSISLICSQLQTQTHS